MLVLSSDLVLSAEEAALPPGTPLIGWHNVVTFGGVTADTTEDGFPVSNVANPATDLEWRAADTTVQYITIATGYVDDIDYVGIARHNFADTGIAVSIGYFDTSSPPVWTELAPAQIPPDNSPMLFRFTPQPLATVMIKIETGSAAARIGVVYCGKLLVMERGVVVDADFPPPTFARKANVVTGRSERGDYLGRIVTGKWLETSFSFAHLTPAWYRSTFEPFARVAEDDLPFFYAWQPATYPYEVAFLWLLDDIMPRFSPVTGRHAITLKVGGILE